MTANPNDLAFALASGMPGAAPAPPPTGIPEAPLMPGEMGAAPTPSPEEMAMAMMSDPTMGAGAASPMGPVPPELMGPQYPTADAQFMAQALEQIVQMQQADHQQLAMDQQSALTSNPIFEALVSGAPLTPGAGQDGQALGPIQGEMPPVGGPF